MHPSDEDDAPLSDPPLRSSSLSSGPVVVPPRTRFPARGSSRCHLGDQDLTSLIKLRPGDYSRVGFGEQLASTMSQLLAAKPCLLMDYTHALLMAQLTMETNDKERRSESAIQRELNWAPAGCSCAEGAAARRRR